MEVTVSLSSLILDTEGDKADEVGSSTSASPSMNHQQQHLLPPTSEDNQHGYLDPHQTPSPTLNNGEGQFRRGPSTPGVRISRMLMGKPGGPPPPPGPPRTYFTLPWA